MEDIGATQPVSLAVASLKRKKKTLLYSLSWQVLFGIAVAIVLGYFKTGDRDCHEAARRRLHPSDYDDYAVIIFCTVVTGIAGMEDMKKVGRVGGKALLYFEVVSTLALLLGLVVGNVVKPGAGFNVKPGHA